ncbi:MAG: HAD family hydrolase [Myxococcota bacterium]|jgi:HAD superfamily hydrolase (TIGR01509 family)|nr:HAD family hydrolase [Myxococcota bacterium]
MTIRAVSFDLFDTLVDLLSEGIPMEDYGGRSVPWMLARVHALVDAKIPLDFDDYLRVMKGVDEAFRESHFAQGREVSSLERFRAVLEEIGTGDEDLAHAMVEAHMEGLYRQVRVLDHHPEVLTELGRELRLGVCSNFSHSKTAYRVLQAAELGDSMDAVLISDAVGYRKPGPEIFRATLEALAVEPQELLHVGDRLGADVQGAAALGIRTVWIDRRVKDAEAALAARPGCIPDFQISDLSELPALVSEAAGLS